MVKIDELLHEAFVRVDFSDQSNGFQRVRHQQPTLLHQERHHNGGGSGYSEEAVDVDDAAAFDGILDEVGRGFEEGGEIEGRIVIGRNAKILNAIVLIRIAFSGPVNGAEHVALCYVDHVGHLEITKFG